MQVAVGVRRAVVQGERLVAGVLREPLAVGVALGPPADAVGLPFGQFGAHREVGPRQVQGRAVVAAAAFGSRAWNAHGSPRFRPPHARPAAGTSPERAEKTTSHGERAVPNQRRRSSD